MGSWSLLSKNPWWLQNTWPLAHLPWLSFPLVHPHPSEMNIKQDFSLGKTLNLFAFRFRIFICKTGVTSDCEDQMNLGMWKTQQSTGYLAMWILRPFYSFILFFFLLFKKMLFIFRERGREREREGEKHQCVVASQVPSTRDLAHHPGMCPWLRIEPVTLCFIGWHSIHGATPARAYSCILVCVAHHAEVICVHFQLTT